MENMEKIEDMGMWSKKICGRYYNSYDCNSDRCYKEIEKTVRKSRIIHQKQRIKHNENQNSLRKKKLK